MPVGKALVQAGNVVAMLPQKGDRLVGKDAVGTATIGHNLCVRRKFCETRLQFRDRQGTRMRKMSREIFLSRSNVEYNHLLIVQATEQFLSRERLPVLPVMQVGLDHPVNFRELRLADGSQGVPQREHTVVSQSVVHRDTLAAHLDQMGRTQYLQVLRSVRYGHASFFCQSFHRALALGKHLKQFEAMRISERLANARELLVELILKSTFIGLLHSVSFLSL